MAKKGFVCTQATEKVGLIKKDLLAKEQDLFQKKSQEKYLLRKKGFTLQKNRNCKLKNL